MNKHAGSGSFALLAVIVAGWVFAHHGPIDTVIDVGDKQGPVFFPHARHTEVVEQCVTCHHTNEGLTAESDTNVQNCLACHLEPEAETVPGVLEMSMTKNAFHISCAGCHKEQAKGPTKCTECHQKKR